MGGTELFPRQIKALSVWPLLTLSVLTLTGCQGPTTVIGRTASSTGQKAESPRVASPTAAQKIQILVKFKSELRATEMQAFRSTYGLRNVGMIQALGVYVEELEGDRPVEALLKELNASPLVEYAELNGQVSIP